MRVYPVFVTNLTSCELRSPGQLVGCPATLRYPTSGDYINNSLRVKLPFKIFIEAVCEFHRRLWKGTTRLFPNPRAIREHQLQCALAGSFRLRSVKSV
jgi:hypothetical protein